MHAGLQIHCTLSARGHIYLNAMKTGGKPFIEQVLEHVLIMCTVSLKTVP